MLKELKDTNKGTKKQKMTFEQNENINKEKV